MDEIPVASSNLTKILAVSQFKRDFSIESSAFITDQIATLRHQIPNSEESLLIIKSWEVWNLSLDSWPEGQIYLRCLDLSDLTIPDISVEKWLKPQETTLLTVKFILKPLKTFVFRKYVFLSFQLYDDLKKVYFGSPLEMAIRVKSKTNNIFKM